MILDLIKDGSKGEGWVQVFPRGKFFINKYNLWLTCDEAFFAQVQSWWENSKFKKPYLDKDHEFKESYGQFSDLRITDQGLEMFLVLNDPGKELLKIGQYQYLSPTFMDMKDVDGNPFKNVLVSVSLVNSPALMTLEPLQTQIALSGQNIRLGGNKVDLKTILCTRLNLSLGADDGSILGKLEELINSGATIDDLKQQVEDWKAQAGAAEASAKDAMAKCEIAQTEADKAKKAQDDSAEELKLLKLGSLQKEAEDVIDLAIANQQYHPSLKDMKMKLYLVNKEDVLKELELIPKKESDKRTTVTDKKGNELKLSAEAIEIYEKAGYDMTKPEDVALALSVEEKVNSLTAKEA